VGVARPDRDAAPESSLDEALARARRHAKSALAEALEAVRALLDAASLATAGATAETHPLFAAIDQWFARTSRGFAAEGGLAGGIVAEIAEALDSEIARWEERAKHDADARSVLRAFLGLREVLWELGVRASFAQRAEGERRPSGEHARADDARSRSTEPAATRPRVQRVAVQG
jgi:hypothetical protein